MADIYSFLKPEIKYSNNIYVEPNGGVFENQTWAKEEYLRRKRAEKDKRVQKLVDILNSNIEEYRILKMRYNENLSRLKELVDRL